MKILILTHDEITRLLPMDECITVMRQALLALARGEVYQPLRTIIRPPAAAGILGMMPSFISGERAAFGVKVICVFHGNPALCKDAHQGSVLLFDSMTGELRALLNASAVTAIRTAAVSGVATELLAREDACDLAIIGAGVQARSHLAAMAHVRPIKRARVVSRTAEHARAFAEEMSARYPFPVEPVESVEAAVRGADLIVTVTNSSQPVLKRDWLSPGAHLNVVGSSIPTSREVEGEVMAASSLFVDRRESTIHEAGDYLMAAKEGLIGPDHIRAEVGEVLDGLKPGRTSPEEVTLFKSLGLAVEDLAAAEYVYAKAQKQQAGTWVQF